MAPTSLHAAFLDRGPQSRGKAAGSRGAATSRVKWARANSDVSIVPILMTGFAVWFTTPIMMGDQSSNIYRTRSPELLKDGKA
jgi:hypothetical protein